MTSPIVIRGALGSRERAPAGLTARPAGRTRGLGWKSIRYLPICTSSPAARTTSSMRSRLT